MPTPIDTMEVLNDLIKINNHWIEGYEYALKELKLADADLKVLFQLIVEKSQRDNSDDSEEEKTLINIKRAQTPFGRVMLKGWMNIIALFSVRGRSFILRGKKDIASENLPADLKEMIANQKFILKSSQDEIKASEGMRS